MEDSCSVTKSCLTLCNPMVGIIAHQVPLSMEFSRQRYWSGLQFPSSGNLPSPWLKLKFPASPASQVDSLPLNHHGSPMEFYSVIKKNEIFSSEITWMDLERIMLCEINQTERQILYISIYMWTLQSKTNK